MLSTFNRLRAAAASADCSFIAAAGNDALPSDGSGMAFLRHALCTVRSDALNAPESELVVVVTPRAILIHSDPEFWEEFLAPSLENATGSDENVVVEAYVPSGRASAEEKADFKLEALRLMIERALGEARGGIMVAGSMPTPLVEASWPLLQIAMIDAPLTLRVGSVATSLSGWA